MGTIVLGVINAKYLLADSLKTSVLARVLSNDMWNIPGPPWVSMDDSKSLIAISAEHTEYQINYWPLQLPSQFHNSPVSYFTGFLWSKVCATEASHACGGCGTHFL
jgi:hypothetical protein